MQDNIGLEIKSLEEKKRNSSYCRKECRTSS